MHKSLEQRAHQSGRECAENHEPRVKQSVKAAPLHIQPAKHRHAGDHRREHEVVHLRYVSREHKRHRCGGPDDAGDGTRDAARKQSGALSRDEGDSGHDEREDNIRDAPGGLVGRRNACCVDEERPCEGAAHAEKRRVAPKRTHELFEVVSISCVGQKHLAPYCASYSRHGFYHARPQFVCAASFFKKTKL